MSVQQSPPLESPLLAGTPVRRPIDAFAPVSAGAYVDDLVEVHAGLPPEPAPGRSVRTEHFLLTPTRRRLRIDHAVPVDRVDDDLAGLLAEELFGPGWLRGPEVFERVFTGVVRTVAEDPVDAWEVFYRNTLARVEDTLGSPGSSCSGGHGTVADYAPVYARAEQELAEGTVLELGACFGFLSLRLAAHGRRVTATDLSTGTTDLLAAVAPRLGVTLDTAVADAAHFPGPDGCADTVLAVHLLEHLDPDEGDQVVAEALRLARRRVVVAVPLETEADETWGHVRTVTLDDLRTWGRTSARPHRVFEDHGGWLVVDLP